SNSLIFLDNRRVASGNELLLRFPVFQLIARRDQALIGFDAQVFTDKNKILIVDLIFPSISEYPFVL
ncbi:MAG: hypothetical protein VW835_19730, partial [Rickettsiales bacterium]